MFLVDLVFISVDIGCINKLRVGNCFNFWGDVYGEVAGVMPSLLLFEEMLKVMFGRGFFVLWVGGEMCVVQLFHGYGPGGMVSVVFYVAGRCLGRLGYLCRSLLAGSSVCGLGV